MKIILFKENQKFNQKWLWIILFLAAITPILILILDEGFKLDTSNFVLISMMLLPLFLIYFTELRVEISRESLKYQFYPFHLKVYEIKHDEIETYDQITYSPLKDYGGWGINHTVKGSAYNISGNKGVKMILKNGKKILFGSQKAKEFYEALNQTTEQ
tara:strand:- start:1311 stop:1784 length:474 start_codon:yes stop_codon:yes gene_type:complete